MASITGKFLNQLWQIGAKHALYSHNGTWYHRLERFPGALCDSEGYILFQTRENFEGCLPFLRIKQDVGCPGGIRVIPGYVRCEAQEANDIDEPALPERVLQTVSRIVRDTAVSSEVKLMYDHECQLCGKTIELCGRNYSEAHHIRPLGSKHGGHDTKDNVLCVCPNCHVLLDFAAIPLSLSSLRAIKHTIRPANVDYHNALHKASLSNFRKPQVAHKRQRV